METTISETKYVNIVMTILITGPECSGKSTLAEQLSTELLIPCIQEHARNYLYAHGSDYCYADLLQIAQEHAEILDSSDGGSYLLDTYLLNIKIWSEYKYGKVDPWIITQLSHLRFDHILLMEPDIEWTHDKLRENPDNRYELFDIYRRELNTLDWTYDIISGSYDERLSRALDLLR